MAADFGQPAALHRAAIDGDALANLVVIADLQPRRLALVGNILRRHADGAKGKEAIVRADLRRPFDRNMRHQMAALAQFDVRADHAIGPDLARRRNLRARINDGRGMYRSWTSNDGILGRWILTIAATLQAAQRSANSRRQRPLRFAPRPRELSMSWHDTMASATRLLAHVGVALHLCRDHARHRTPALHFHFQPQLVARAHRPPELARARFR